MLQPLGHLSRPTSPFQKFISPLGLFLAMPTSLPIPLAPSLIQHCFSCLL